MSFSPIRSLLPFAARRAGITKDLAITKALHAAQGELERIFGKNYSMFAEPVAVKQDGAFVISCRSPAVAQTVRLNERAVLESVRAAAPSLNISRIYLVPRSRSDVAS